MVRIMELIKYNDEFKDQTVERMVCFFGFHTLLFNENDISSENYKAAEETLEEWIKCPSELYMIMLENEIVGFLRLSYRGSNVAWIEDLFVDPQHRNKGIATQAIQIAEDMVKLNPNFTAICFDVVPRNDAALKLYYKLGYNSLSIITIRKELYENKRDRKTDVVGLEFNY